VPVGPLCGVCFQPANSHPLRVEKPYATKSILQSCRILDLNWVLALEQGICGSAFCHQFFSKTIDKAGGAGILRLKGGAIMARSDKRYMVYPAPRAIEIIGSTSPSLNQALECWAALLARATADNARDIWDSFIYDEPPQKYEVQPLHEWAVIAEVLKEMRFDPEFANPGVLLATAVEDGHRLESVANNWFLWGEEGPGTDDPDKAIQKLTDKLRGLDYSHAWAVISAVQWFWDHHDEGIDIKKDRWWTLAFRRQWQPKKAQKHNRRGDSTDQKQGKRKKTEPNR
jgi:hypothetical protein